MSGPTTIPLLRSGNRLCVNTQDSYIRGILEHELTFTTRKFNYGKERRIQKSNITIEDVQCYQLDAKNRVVTSSGFYSRIRDLLKSNGYSTSYQDLTDRKPLIANFDRIFDPRLRIKLRHGQDEFLIKLSESVAAYQPARFDCPPGFGKSFAVAMVILMYPQARIDVVSKRVAVLRDRIYPDLCQLTPNVGMVGGGKKSDIRRVMLYTVDSLHQSHKDADILVVDECHEAASDDAAYQLGGYSRSVNLGLSATHDMRLDNKDYRVEALFGPIVYSMNYAEAAAHGLVVPIEVHWRKVRMDYNPCSGLKDPTERKRHGIWRNEYRNSVIAEDARSYGDDVQRLITVETLEHALFLKKLLPDFELVYSEADIDQMRMNRFRNLGIWPDDMPRMTTERRAWLTTAFEENRLKKAIVTTVWNVGVSFNHLQVLLRADAGGSTIMDTQIPGRTSRNATGKLYGIVRDYEDMFDKSFRSRSRKRRNNYEDNGWQQVDEQDDNYRDLFSEAPRGRSAKKTSHG